MTTREDVLNINSWPKSVAVLGVFGFLAFGLKECASYDSGLMEAKNKPEILKLEAQKAEAEARKAEAELKKAEIEAGKKDKSASNDNSWRDRVRASEKARQLVASTWVI